MKLYKMLPAFSLVFAMVFSSTVQAGNDVIRVGTDATFPPLEFVKNGQRTGFDIDLINALAKAMGMLVPGIALLGAARNASSVDSFQTMPDAAMALE